MRADGLLIVAGEVSGDIHAANLLLELRRADPGIRAFGVGGERLREAGLECVACTEELAHMGLVEVLRELPRLRRVMGKLVETARRRRPALAVLVDSPDFNLRLARRLGRLGIPSVLYVSPQLWAWRRGRVRTVRRVAREVLCILPFEVDFYRQHGVRARYVGHPLVDDLERQGLLRSDSAPTPGRLALLPGSRVMEVRQLLPTMVAALRGLPRSRFSDVVLIEAPGVAHAVSEVLATTGSDPRLRRVGGAGRRHELAGCEMAWTASGTATLECALLDVPMVVGYRLRPLSFLLARMLVRVPHVALVNLIAGCRAVPELLQSRWNPSALARVTGELSPACVERQRSELARVRSRLGGSGASIRAARVVASYLGRGRDPDPDR